jgi:ATP-dependent RNA helicase DDX20
VNKDSIYIYRAQNMTDALNSKGWPTACIAGSLDQKDRNLAMSKLKTFQCRVLISTDLVSNNKNML